MTRNKERRLENIERGLCAVCGHGKLDRPYSTYYCRGYRLKNNENVARVKRNRTCRWSGPEVASTG